MKVLITGPDGLLGSNLVRKMLSMGHQVQVLIHTSSPAKTISGLNIEKFYGDILTPETIIPAMEGCDAVIHAAANTNVWPVRSERIRAVNINGTKNVVNAALALGIKRFIYIGSASSVNSNKQNGISQVADSASTQLDYIDSKREALKYVLDTVETKNLPAICILPTFMIGPYDALPSSGKMLLAFVKGKLYFFTSGGRNFVHVSDVADAVLNALAIGTIGKCYIAGNENLSYGTFLKRAADVLGKPAPLMQMPDFIVKSAGWLGSLYGNTFKTKPLLSYPLACISCENQFVSAVETVKELNMPQTNIDVAIRDCYEWFKAEGYC